MSTETAVFDHYGPAETRGVLPGQILRTLSRRWLLLGLFGLIGGALGLAIASQMTRTYTASGDIVIDLKSFAIPELQGAVSGQGSPDPLPAVRTAAIELSSQPLLQSVVEQLHLTNYPYFNADLREPTILELAIGKIEAALPALFPATPGRPGEETALAAMALAKRLTVFYDNRSLAVTVSVVLPDPQLATQIVNAILNRYIAVQGNSRVEYNAAANADIMAHLNDVRKQVDALDAKARDLRAENGLVTVNPSGSLGQQRLSELGTLQAQAVADLQQLQAKLSLATQLTAHGNAAELADVLSSQTISRLRDQQSLAGQRLAKLDATVAPGSRLREAAQSEYQEVQKQIGYEAQRIVKSLSEQVAAARDRVKAATAALDNASSAAGAASLIQANIAQVEKEAESRRQVYQALLERASQTAVSPEVARQAPGVYIGSPAVVPVFPSGPHTKIVFALGVLAGLMAGSVVAIKRGKDLPLAATPDEIASYVQVPLLGVIPVSRRQPLKPVTAQWSPCARNPQDQALGLLYSRLRSQAAHQGRELRSVLFIGADGEETSPLARRFANVASREGERVLLIDTRSEEAPRAAAKAGGNGGLRAVLDGQQAWRDVLVQAPESPANLLPVGGAAWNEFDRKAGTRLRSMMREAADDYTLVVIASRWDAKSIEASHLVHAADFTLLVVQSGKARPSAVKEAVKHLTSITDRLGLTILSRAT
jgi:uncharacterized protein involved in exopolysaccharide biosynthesis/Mrp family chromosome partitioning ATPase